MSKNRKQQVTIAWLDPGEVKSDFCASVMDLFRTRSHVVSGRIVVRSGGGITRGRNRAVHEFLNATTDDWLLFLDSDMSFTVDTFDKVFNNAHREKAPVVGALCFAQSGYHAGPFATLIPTLYVATEPAGYKPAVAWPDEQMVPVDATGCAFLLIHRSVLETMQQTVQMGRWSWFHERPALEIDNWVSEDVAFCELVRALGYPIYVHTGAKTGHVKGIDYVLDEQMYHLLTAATARVDT